MNRKKIKIGVLITLTLIVWVSIGIKLSKRTNTKRTTRTSDQNQGHSIKQNSETEIYQIRLDYEDPFFPDYRVKAKPLNKKANSPVKRKPKFKKPKVLNTPVKPWPKIRYHGLVTSSLEEEKIALVTCNKVTDIVRQGDSRESIVFLELWKDSILVERLGNSRKVIRK